MQKSEWISVVCVGVKEIELCHHGGRMESSLKKQELKEVLLYEEAMKFQGQLIDRLYDDTTEVFQLVCDYIHCSYIAFLSCDAKGMVHAKFYNRERNCIVSQDRLLNVDLVDIFAMNHMEEWTVDEIPERIKALLQRDHILNAGSMLSFGDQTNGTLYHAFLIFPQNIEMEGTESLKKILLRTLKSCLEKRIFYENVSYESYHDMLTKLYNRRSYFQRCREEYPHANSIGIVYFDVNNLKKVNDQYGHDAGDALLQKAAESFRGLTGDHVHAYRMGGDEFILVMPDCTMDELSALLNQWEQELQKVNEKYGGEPCVIAVGSAFAKGGFEIEEVCAIADKRMYRDKIQKKENEAREIEK